MLCLRAAAFKEKRGKKEVNIESESCLSQMRRKGKRGADRAHEDEKKSMRNTKRREKGRVPNRGGEDKKTE